MPDAKNALKQIYQTDEFFRLYSRTQFSASSSGSCRHARVGERVQSTTMQRVMISALLASALYLPAAADPLQIAPDAYAGQQGWQAPAPAAVEPQASGLAQPRYASASQPNMGGGFIEMLFGGGAQQPYAQQHAYQPAMP
jgi:hypothetical protein